MPAHLTLIFERGAELATALRKQIAQHGWEVASAEAYPWLLVMDQNLSARTATATEVTIAEALARALPVVLADITPALLAAWSGGTPVQQTLEVTTQAGTFNLTLTAAEKPEPAASDLLMRLHAARPSNSAVGP